ncbi:MAG: hypothetical protein ACRBI6_15380 [Acidimicrobiales bacterium]
MAVSVTIVALLGGCLPGGDGASPASDPVPEIADPRGGTGSLDPSPSAEALCASAAHFCVVVIEGPRRPSGGRSAIASLEAGASDDTTVTRIELTTLRDLADALETAVAGFPDLVVVLPPQGTEPFALPDVRAAAEAWPTFRFVTIGPAGQAEGQGAGEADAGTTTSTDRAPGDGAPSDEGRSNLAVITVDAEAWGGVAADAALLAAPEAVIGLVVGPDLDPGVGLFVDGFRATAEADGSSVLAELHPGALDGSHADPVWDAVAAADLVSAGASLIVADHDGLYDLGDGDGDEDRAGLDDLDVPCVVAGPRPEPAPGCAIGVADPGVDAALSRILERRRSGTGPSGLVVTEPRLVRVAGG